MKITMSDREIAMIQSFMAKADNYFEYGMGGSTCLAARTVRNHVSAIDSDAEWVSKVRTELEKDAKSVRAVHVDIGATGNWGMPVDRSAEARWPDYSRAILNDPEDFDLCLVDGRFRVACFLTAMAHMRSDAIACIHDYTPRDYYKVVEKYTRPICGVDTIMFFARRADKSPQELMEAADSFRLDPK